MGRIIDMSAVKTPRTSISANPTANSATASAFFPGVLQILTPWGEAVRAAHGYPASGPHDLAKLTGHR